MDGLAVALSGFAALLGLMALRIPIALAMAITGLAGTAYVSSTQSAIYILRNAPFERASSYTFLIIPLFLLMGFVSSQSGLSQSLFRAANAWLGQLRGGLAMATVFSSAAFGAICGSSIATAAAVSGVVLPEMKRYRYSDALATGSIAAGGTLGIMIPPSIIFVLYAIVTETSPGYLLLAGIVPGIIGMALFMLAIAIWVRIDPDIAPPGDESDRTDRLSSLQDMWPIVLLFTVVVGSIYTGLATPTESAAFGAMGAITIGVLRRKLSWTAFRSAITQTVVTSGMIFFIVIGADMFSFFVALTQMPMTVAAWFTAADLSATTVLMIIFVIYLALGAVMDEISMLLLTVPIFFPLITALGVDPIWFGVMIVVTVQLGMITPPVGINVFVIAGMAPDVPIQTIFRGVLPFVLALFCLTAILFAFPSLPTLILR